MATETHWKKLTDPNYLGSWDVTNGKIVATIKRVEQKRIFNQTKNGEESCVVAEFVEPYKPMVLNKTNCKTLQKLTGTPYIERWAGHRIEIHVDKVKAFGELVEALRIGKTAPSEQAQPPKQTAKAEPIACSDCGTVLVEFGGYSPEQIALSTKGKYGRALCWECAKKAKEGAK